MRGTIIAVGLVAAVLAGGWLGAETMAARHVAALIRDDPGLEAASVAPLRDPRQIGIRLSEPQLRDPALSVAMPWARLSLSPLSPLTARLDLPDAIRVVQAGQAMDLAWQDPRASVALAPLNRMAPDALDLQARAVTLDGLPMAQGLSLRADLGALGSDAPRPARAAYDIAIALEGVQTQALAMLGLDAGPLPGPISVRGPLRVWLDATPSLGADAAPGPQVVGWQTAGLDMQAGDIGLRLVGRLSRDAQGRAEGQVALYSPDADAMIGLAEGLGLIPPQGRLLLRAGLAQLAQAPLDATLPGPAFPEPAPGELRLPVIMRDGQLILGGLPVGPAPAI